MFKKIDFSNLKVTESKDLFSLRSRYDAVLKRKDWIEVGQLKAEILEVVEQLIKTNYFASNDMNDSLAWLGWSLAFGENSFSQDAEQGIKLLKIGALAGCFYCKRNLAQVYSGVYAEIPAHFSDPEESIKLFKEIIQLVKESSSVIYRDFKAEGSFVHMMARINIEVLDSYNEEAIDCLKKALRRGNPEAFLYLYSQELDKSTFLPEILLGIQDLEIDAEKTNENTDETQQIVLANFALAHCYIFGDGVEKDDEKARDMLTKSLSLLDSLEDSYSIELYFNVGKALAHFYYDRFGEISDPWTSPKEDLIKCYEIFLHMYRKISNKKDQFPEQYKYAKTFLARFRFMGYGGINDLSEKRKLKWINMLSRKAKRKELRKSGVSLLEELAADGDESATDWLKNADKFKET